MTHFDKADVCAISGPLHGGAGPMRGEGAGVEDWHQKGGQEGVAHDQLEEGAIIGVRCDLEDHLGRERGEASGWHGGGCGGRWRGDEEGRREGGGAQDIASGESSHHD